MLAILFSAICAGLIAGWWRAGRKLRVQIPLRGAPWIIAALLVQIATLSVLRPLGPTVMAVSLAVSMGFLFWGIWIDRSPAMLLVALGAALNFTVMVANGGLMPLSSEAVAARDLHPGAVVGDVPARVKGQIMDPENIRFLFLADIIHSPDGGLLSIGDIVLAIGVGVLAWECLGRRRIETA